MTNQTKNIDVTVANWESGKLRGDFPVKAVTTPVAASHGIFPKWLHTNVLGALTVMGVQKPFAHQVDAWNQLHDNHHLVIATPTASGKTLCYNVPVVDGLLKDERAKALYLFPTKALARDQESSVRKLIALCQSDAKAVVYDGDTNADIRRSAKQSASVIITNPDMLHTGILPHHTSWAQFFSNLEYVVIDELHHYRGVFGSHVANVFRRLKRITDFYGACPKFISCSATIGNPKELASKVVGVDHVELITQSGAPTGKKTFMIYNPEVVDPVMGTRASVFRVAARLAGDLVKNDVSTLVFCQTRRGVEIVLHYLRDRLKLKGDDAKLIRGYRGGYLPTLRREIESALREGEVKAVVATNALELGIDVGELDAVLLAGYPGTIAATHQRSGRAGRRQDPSLSVLIARSTPIDQFLAKQPQYILDATPEVALVQPDNVEILLNHVKCAAFELPFHSHDSFGSISIKDSQAVLECLSDEGALKKSKDRFHYISDEYPAANVNLRVAHHSNVVVYNTQTNEPIAEVAPHSARFELHEGAIYQHDGDTYEVESFDYEQFKAYVKPVEPVYYTTAVDQTKLNELYSRQEKNITHSTLYLGDVEVIENVIGYKKIKFKSHENLGYGDISLPPLTMETEAVWLVFHSAVTQSFDTEQAALALEGLKNAICQVATLRLMCDPRDIEGLVQTQSQKEGALTHWQPVLYLYDTHVGGVGLSERAYEEMELILADAGALISGCSCVSGCPVCIGPVSKENIPVKDIAKTILALLFQGSKVQS